VKSVYLIINNVNNNRRYYVLLCDWLAPVAKPKQDWFVKTTLLKGVRDKRTEKTRFPNPKTTNRPDTQSVGFRLRRVRRKKLMIIIILCPGIHRTLQAHIIYIFICLQYIVKISFVLCRSTVCKIRSDCYIFFCPSKMIILNQTISYCS